MNKVHLHEYLSATPSELAALPDSTVDWLVAQAVTGAVPEHQGNDWWIMCGHSWSETSPKPIADIGYCRVWVRVGPLLEELLRGIRTRELEIYYCDGEFCVYDVSEKGFHGGEFRASTAPRAVALAYLAWKLAELKAQLKAAKAGKEGAP